MAEPIPPIPPSDLISTDEAAKLVPRTAQTLRRLARAGVLKSFQVRGRIYLSKADVLDLFAPVPVATKAQASSTVEEAAHVL